ncbi:MAG TPA: hypothetical protein ENK44_03185 [Caldithrix abyssi]|uniref:Stage II sporulation protein M n=1 Tax=Caldithrix abyssi TaxID=187145 RepID=A0A7V4TYT8_CALAY|nr:hypothetical protein [Caldithrix abyssi]
MLDFIYAHVTLIHIQVFLFSILAVMTGYVFAPTVQYKQIRFLMIYPLWIESKLEKWSPEQWNSLMLFLFLFCLNLFSLFIDLLSGLVPFLPLVFAVWSGINIGLITYRKLDGQFYYLSLINPVSVFELPAVFITFTAAIQYNLRTLGIHLTDLPQADARAYLELFLIIVLPLTLIAGVVETGLIKLIKRMENENEKEDDE